MYSLKNYCLSVTKPHSIQNTTVIWRKTQNKQSINRTKFKRRMNGHTREASYIPLGLTVSSSVFNV